MAEPTQITQILPSPVLEGALTAFTQKLPPLMGERIQTETYAPQIAQQASFTQAAQQAAARQAGLGALTFDPTTGAVTQVGAGTGIAGYEPYLQEAQRLTGAAETTLGGVAPYQQQLQTAGTTLGGATQYMGPQAYQAFMSPYQQDVIQATEDLLQRQRQQGLGALQAQAVGAGAFGGAREGVARGAYEAERDIGIASQLANLRQAGLQQAQQQAAQAFAQQQALAQEQARQAGQGFTQQQSLAQQQAQLGQQQLGFAQQQPALAAQQISQLGTLGQSDLAYRQALIDAQAAAAREAQYEPFTRLGLIGQQLAQIQPGAFPTQTVGYQQPQAPASPLQTVLGVGTGLAGLAGSMKGIFG
jgi:hypothetical protein